MRARPHVPERTHGARRSMRFWWLPRILVLALASTGGAGILGAMSAQGAAPPPAGETREPQAGETGESGEGGESAASEAGDVPPSEAGEALANETSEALAGEAPRPSAHAASLSRAEAAELRRDDRGLYLAFCPHGHPAAIMANARAGEPAAGAMSAASALEANPPAATLAGALPMASAAEANHDGWPADQCLKMDKGPVGRAHTLVGVRDVHNWLLGGYGNDIFYGGEAGDVIWGDYHPAGQPEDQADYIHGGAGADWIYSSHGFNEIWTGAGSDHLALVYGHGVVHCDGAGVKTFVMRYLPENRPWRLIGCTHKVLVRYRA